MINGAILWQAALLLAHLRIVNSRRKMLAFRVLLVSDARSGMGFLNKAFVYTTPLGFQKFFIKNIKTTSAIKIKSFMQAFIL